MIAKKEKPLTKKKRKREFEDDVIVDFDSPDEVVEAVKAEWEHDVRNQQLAQAIWLEARINVQEAKHDLICLENALKLAEDNLALSIVEHYEGL